MIRKLAALLVSSPSGSELSPEERELLRDLAPRHFIFFRRHFQDREAFEALGQALREASPVLAEEPGLWAVDQEGGRVQRIGPPLAPEYPEPLEVARKGPEAVERFSRELARSVKSLGLNLNLAPVVDLAGEEAPDFIRGRTLGEDPEEVARLTQVFIRTHLAEGVFPCAKHFPGLGGLEPDPHEELPEIPEVDSRALIPFRAAVEANVPLVMTTHLRVRVWDDKPVTFSEVALQRLREELAFEGLVLTDDLAMGALRGWEPAERLLYVLLSGHDLWLYCRPLPEIFEALEELSREVAGSRVLRERLTERLFRVDRKLREFFSLPLSGQTL